MVISTRLKTARAQKAACDKFGITALDQLVDPRYCPAQISDHFSKDLHRLAQLECRVAVLRPLLEAAVEDRWRQNPRRRYLTSKDLIHVESHLRAEVRRARLLRAESAAIPESLPSSPLPPTPSQPSPTLSLSPLTSPSAPQSQSPSLSPPPPDSPSPASSPPRLPSPSPRPSHPNEMSESLLQSPTRPSREALSVPVLPDQAPQPQPAFSSRKRRRVSTMRLASDTDAALPALAEYLPHELRDSLDKAAADLQEVLDRCIPHFASVVSACEQDAETAAHAAAEAQKALEQAKTSATTPPPQSQSSTPDDVNGTSGTTDQQLERDLAAALQKEAALSAKRAGFLRLSGVDADADADAATLLDDNDRSYLAKLDALLAAEAAAVSAARLKLEECWTARAAAAAERERLQGLADGAAVAEERARGALRCAEEHRAGFAQYRVVVALGPLEVHRVLAKSFRDLQALLDYTRE